jgi:serine/threonine protein phosphatase PrpC
MKEGDSMSAVESALVKAYLTNVQLALHQFDIPYAEVLLEHALDLMNQSLPPLPASPALQFSLGTSLDAGTVRRGKPNEDAVFAATGCHAQTHETYAVAVVTDGMGGHAQGQVASRLGITTIVDAVFPHIQQGHSHVAALGNVLIQALRQANQRIYECNQVQADDQLASQMGTTVTAALVLGPSVCLANVGDSRAYLYRPGVGLRALTRDHSMVANLLAAGVIGPEEVYTHPERNMITRCLGIASTVEIDLFYEQLQDGDILLLCSDGVWEMTRDSALEGVLSSSWLSAENMAERLMHLAFQGGGRDNIGLVVLQCQMQMDQIQTLLFPLVDSAPITG